MDGPFDFLFCPLLGLILADKWQETKSHILNKKEIPIFFQDEWDSWGNDASAPALDNDLDDKKKQVGLQFYNIFSCLFT